MKETQSLQFQMRITPTHRQVLEKLAEMERRTMAQVVLGLIEQSARRCNIWPSEVENRPAEPEKVTGLYTILPSGRALKLHDE